MMWGRGPEAERQELFCRGASRSAPTPPPPIPYELINLAGEVGAGGPAFPGPHTGGWEGSLRGGRGLTSPGPPLNFFCLGNKLAGGKASGQVLIYHSVFFFYAGCWMADSCQGLLPTGRVKVQYSSNFTGSVLLPWMIWPLVSSTL